MSPIFTKDAQSERLFWAGVQFQFVAIISK